MQEEVSDTIIDHHHTRFVSERFVSDRRYVKMLNDFDNYRDQLITIFREQHLKLKNLYDQQEELLINEYTDILSDYIQNRNT